MQSKKKRDRNWPMNLILGGVLVAGCAVLLAYGLQSDGPEPVNNDRPEAREPVAASLPSVAPVVAEASAEVSIDDDSEAPEAGALAMLEASRAEPTAMADLDPVDEAPSFAEAEEAFQAADYEMASRRFSRYVEVHPGNPWGHYMLGLSQWRAGRLDGAETALNRSLELNADFAKARRNLARVLMSDDRPDEAFAVLSAAAETESALGEHQRLLGRALHNMARPDEALAAYSAALVADPADAWALNNLGLILVEGERFEEALPAFALAADLEPDNAIFMNNLGVVLERRGAGTQAAEAYRRALDLDAGYERARVSLARIEAHELDEEPALDLNTLVAETAGAVEAGRFPWMAATPAAEVETTDELAAVIAEDPIEEEPALANGTW